MYGVIFINGDGEHSEEFYKTKKEAEQAKREIEEMGLKNVRLVHDLGEEE